MLLAVLAGCGVAPTPPEIAVVRVQTRLSLAAGAQPLMAQLSVFVGGRMDALHLAVPPGADALVRRLELAGVRPRKIRRGTEPGVVVAERYLATVPPCSGLDLAGATFGRNDPTPGLGCATLANMAADASDPADLLGNAAVEPPDPDRAVLPVARYRAFAPSAPPPAAAPTVLVR
jgi:pilus assembly protein CpaD